MLNLTDSLLKKKREVEKTNIRFNAKLKKEKIFFSLPNILSLLLKSSIIVIDNFIKQNSIKNTSERDVRNFVKRNKEARLLIEFTNKQIDNTTLSEILLECNIEGINDNDVDSMVGNIEQKLNYDNVNKLNLHINNNTSNFLILYLLYNIKSLFIRSNLPSINRSVYLQKLTHNLYGILQQTTTTIDTNISSIGIPLQMERQKNILQNIDKILQTSILATITYLKNSNKLSSNSKKTLETIRKDNSCKTDNVSDIVDPSDPIIKRKILDNDNIDVDCILLEEDDVIVQQRPIEIKDLELCDVEPSDIDDPVQINSNSTIDIATHAIIENQNETEFITIINVNDEVSEKTIIGTVGDINVYAPVGGIVDIIEPNRVILRDIIVKDENILMDKVELLNEKYSLINEAESIIKYFEIYSLYPEMLSTSLLSTRNKAFSGMYSKFKASKKDFTKIDKKYEKSIKEITSETNIGKHANNNSLISVKLEMDETKKTYYNNIDLLRKKSLATSLITKIKDGELQLFEFYTIELMKYLHMIDVPGKMKEDLQFMINSFSKKRLVIDKYKKNKIESKLNDIIKEILVGPKSGNWFNKMLAVYEKEKKMSTVKKWLSALVELNKKLEYHEKRTFVETTLFMFNIYLNYENIFIEYQTLKQETTVKDETIKEAKEISLFFKKCYDLLKELPEEIKDIENTIVNLSLFNTYSIVKWNENDARLYSIIINDTSCEETVEEGYASPQSNVSYKDIKYWLKYCTFATLASISNPTQGWSTGWIFPAAISLPVVYLPFKCIPLANGFIVLGISICGIYITPLVIVSNLSTDFTTIVGNPLGSVKREIQEIKSSVSKYKKELKKLWLEPMVRETKKNIKNKKIELIELRKEYTKHKESKPQKYERIKTVDRKSSSIEGLLKYNLEYANHLEKYHTRSLEYQESILQQKIDISVLQLRGKILQDMLSTEESVKGISENSKLDGQEKKIGLALNKLENLENSLNKTLSTLPIALHPETVNFGISLKNPKPVINIEDKIDENIDENIVEGILSKFEIKNSILTETDSEFDKNVSKTVINFANYKKTLAKNMSVVIKKDVFPKYENLKVSNLAWISFLRNDFVTTGARTYGFPGFPPLPI